MMKAIKVNGDHSEILSVELKDILGCIQYSKKVNWGLLWLNVTARLENGKSIVDLEYMINKSSTAMPVTWEELAKLSSQINQAFDVLVIGDKDVANIIRYATDQEMYNTCDYTIELLDSSYWIIHSNDDVFIDNLFDKLEGVEYYGL